MKRLKFYILLFCLAVSIPLTFVILRTAEGLAREEKAQLAFFAETLFDEMERELSELVQREENRAVDEYHHTTIGTGKTPRRSPLADPPGVDFILGYLQNNPDGSFQTPYVADPNRVPPERRALLDELRAVNQRFNGRKYHIVKSVPPAPAAKAAAEKKKDEGVGFAERFLSRPAAKSSKSYLGQKETRLEEITQRQALNIAPEEQEQAARTPVIQARNGRDDKQHADERPDLRNAPDHPDVLSAAPPSSAGPAPPSASSGAEPPADDLLQVEVAPFQSVLIDRGHVFIFRRIAVDNQIYRQGFVLLIEPFLRHLAASHFEGQPLARYALLELAIIESGSRQPAVRTGSAFEGQPAFTAERNFAAPYGFLAASLNAGEVPPSPARRPLKLAVAALGAVLLIGLLAIYQSARTVVDMSERRTRFVSSVTHELKTPLTNIRMYIEMLENGIAATPEREQEYLRILGSESARLGRLIDNVLELARLEKRQRRFQWQEGDLADVLDEVRAVMGHKLAQEGFVLNIDAPAVPNFTYDREVLIQVLINLIENSIKFGRQAPVKEITIQAGPAEGGVRLAVCDTGPGIPRQALKKVFDDFYRADTELTRATGGTGLGLALVRKFAAALGGRVQAANNAPAGCTITLLLPLRPPAST